MQSTKIVGLSALLLVAVCAGGASAEDISANKILIKDKQIDPSKRQIMLMSKDPGVLYSEADSPGTKGASVHVYSDSDDYCTVLTAGPNWVDKAGKSWKFKDKISKNQAQVQDGKLLVKIKSGISFSLFDDAPQGTVKATVQFGDAGSRYCMVCTTPKKDDVKQYLAVQCAAAPCGVEPGSCLPTPTTTTTTTTSTTTTTTLHVPLVVVGAIASNGRFNLNMGTGIPAAEAACSSNFAGAHLCTYAELQAGEAAHDLVGLKDTASNAVASFWAYDPMRSHGEQCGVTTLAGPDWTYNTAHLGVGGDAVTLNNGAGTLGALVPGGGANRNCGQSKWIGCCQ